MKKMLLACVCLAGSLPGFGQGRDTAFAVHKLFVQKRGGGEAWAATGMGVAARESIDLRASSSNIHSNALAAAVNGGIPFALGMRQATRYSAEREAFILKQYAEGWSIPPDIRRKLRRKYFHRSARDIVTN